MDIWRRLRLVQHSLRFTNSNMTNYAIAMCRNLVVVVPPVPYASRQHAGSIRMWDESMVTQLVRWCSSPSVVRAYIFIFFTQKITQVLAPPFYLSYFKIGFPQYVQCMVKVWICYSTTYAVSPTCLLYTQNRPLGPIVPAIKPQKVT